MGATLTAGDLRVARVARDPALRPLNSAQQAQVVGQHTAVALRAGTLLTSSTLTDAALPAAGQAMMAVLAKPGQLPARPLRPGDRVLAVTGAGVGTIAPSGAVSQTQALIVTVADVSASAADGTVVIDVLTGQADAAALAREAAAGQVALVLLPASTGTGR